MIRVILADDHRLMREGLRGILIGNREIAVVGEAKDEVEVLAQVRSGGFDILLLDLSMPGRSGIPLINRVLSESPLSKVLVLTMHAEAQFAVRAMRAGALGYLTKENAVTQLIGAIRLVAAGRPYISAQAAEQLALDLIAPEPAKLHSQLSNRELQVFGMLVKGDSVTAIARRLSLSVKTISAHKGRILQKMGMRGLADMVQYALAHGLLPTAHIGSR